ncbi:hypothetical protein KC678_04150, partial [Candidatus Dojkabacteria bacterium]|nr:hypothetical protein [Candidatus Dojkabacteria bacterium]
NINKILITLITLFVFISGFGLSSPTKVKGDDLEEQLKALEAEINAINKEKQELQGVIDSHQYKIEGYSDQIAQIHGEVLVFQKEIDSLALEVRELEINIELLDKKIKETESEIEEIKQNVVVLEKESKARIEDNYIKFRLTSDGSVSETNIFTTEDINAYFKDSQYISLIQEDTNKILINLADLKDELEVKKAELATKLKEVNKEKEAIQVKQDDLELKRDEIDRKKAAYYERINAEQSQIANTQQAIAVFSQEEAQKSSQAEAIRQQIFNSYNPVVQGEWVAAGRPIGNQGCTGLCTGPHLHFMVAVNGQWQDPCGYLKPGGPVGGCGWGNALDWPIGGTVYYTSGFGNRCYSWNGATKCDFHAAIDLAGVPSDTVVFAAHDGYAYKGTDPYGANYVIICQNQNCNEGIKTGYWHLSKF